MNTYSQFRQSLTETKCPTWLKASVVVFITRMARLQKEIHQTEDVARKLDLIAEQNKILSYLSGLSIGVDAEDTGLMNRKKGRKD